MNDHTDTQPTGFRHRSRKALLPLLLLVGGGAAGAIAVAATRPSVTMAPATPTAIRALSDGIVTIRGRAVELFGNKLVVEDATGRALVDLGREGENGGLVRVGETVTAQGRFDDGFIRAAFLVGADGKVHALGPLGGPHHGRGDRGDHRGPPRGDRPADPAPDQAPPPPPAAN